jgi:hypothetical protein
MSLSAPPAAPALWPCDVYKNTQIASLVAQWPMNGPTYPSSLATYLENQGPMPDINALHTQLLQVNADIAAGKYYLSNPSIADPRHIKSFWSDGVDISQTPTVVADPKMYGYPLPPPAPLPVIPSSPMVAGGSGVHAYNGQWV